MPYFHNVFTLPHELNGLILKSESNQRALLNLLFEATSATLQEFARGSLGGQPGFTLVLHTWDQQLRPHFHLHCLIASGALATDNGQPRWVAGGSRFLFPVRGLSKMFRAKFLARLEQLLVDGQLELTDAWMTAPGQRQLLRRLFRKPWVVYSKPPFAGPRKLLDYLSRYTHRVALTSSRLVRFQDGQVTFNWRDRRDGDRRKTMTLPASQFIGRFLRHVLPDRLQRIRSYGFLANRFKQERLATIRQLLGQHPLRQAAPPKPPIAQWMADVTGIDPKRCPCCGESLRESALPNLLTRQRPTQSESVRGPPA